MAVLALLEYGSIKLGAAFDPATKTVSPKQHQLLERFTQDYKRLHKVDIFKYGPKQSLVAQKFVGIINLGRDQIEILPKIDCEAPQVRHNLARMISTVMNLELFDSDSSKTNKSNDGILEIFIQLFCGKLWHAVRRGMVRRYESRSDNLTVLRGRLAVVDQIRHNLARPDRLACVFDEFTDNNPLNQALKAALRVLAKVAQSQANQRQLAELVFCFQDVDDVQPAKIRWELATTNRLSEKYKPLLALARLFIKGQSPDVVTGGGEGFALLFDMNLLFESYIGVIARRVFGAQGLTVGLQGPKRHLAQYASGNPVFELRPDVVVTNGGEMAFVIDTKWKRLKEEAHREGIATSDIYQMYAYAKRYAAPDVLLLYPHHAELGDWEPRRAQYWLNREDEFGGTQRQSISVSTVDLRALKTIPFQLKEIYSCGKL